MTRSRFSRTPEKTEKAQRHRDTATPQERLLWTLLSGRKLGGYRFRRQHPVGPYVLDFYCPDARLAVELDGDQHGREGAPERDAIRDRLLAEEGIEVLRFWNHELGRDGVDVADAVLARLRERGAPSQDGRTIDPMTGRLLRTRSRAMRGGTGRGDGVADVGAIGGSSPPAGDPRKAGDPPIDPLTPEAFAALAHVPRETLDRLKAYDALLLSWSDHTNLVARSTLADRWRRHFLDSAQLFPLLPKDAKTLVDFGSGAGFPGLVLAALGQAQGLKVFLIESIGKKAAFLSEAAEAMGLDNVAVLPQRIESLTLPPPDVITARALASLDRLCGYAFGLAGPTTRCLFLKGQDVENELTEATKSWTMDVVRRPSRTEAGATILDIRSLAEKPGRPSRKDQRHASAQPRHRQSKRGGRQDDDRDQSRDRPRRGRGKGAAHRS
jgi:16S rRNA (guanine527-N7)-methyltransferase